MPLGPKKAFYIFCCVILGILLSFILHVIIELPIIFIMVTDMSRYSFGLSWNELMAVHWMFTGLMLAGGMFFGYRAGKRWWKYIYIDKKYGGIVKKLKERRENGK
jgi:hypothetical protein